ncbi:hypothetical protein VOI54_00800 [Tamlana sp. 2201CG12-4]|uniref:hypothetical protein n=1 Tax=Tamlana sp. 2201CG12-4 TaxID=3112582 RepID=UPI002DBEE9E5|nr:hypothetical protein [Tamlana sp. 2201CG12-4]MEC3905545.1 hypothetical protein [Tamlana sp. 2201CG12-4]
MTTEILEKLKNDLDALKIKTFEKKRATRKKDRESIEEDIQFMTKRMLKNYELIKYDEGITMEYYKTNFFIFDVEDIIRNLEREE